MTDTVNLVWTDCQDHSDTHIEDFKHFFMLDMAVFFKCRKDWEDWNLVFFNLSCKVARKHTRHIFDETTTCDMGNTINQPCFYQWQYLLDIDTCRL
ncbi:Uncharacterised protein [Klebsiella pneumoniae]|nr:Uncharacterised protein [Klebsiella pneumoniae]